MLGNSQVRFLGGAMSSEALNYPLYLVQTHEAENKIKGKDLRMVPLAGGFVGEKGFQLKMERSRSRRVRIAYLSRACGMRCIPSQPLSLLKSEVEKSKPGR